ncbi:MAG: nuclear transport factor 2 family protein [Dehalococcoidales bacterium]|nr:nuclear transport factor 2 family protein [Dehalococcoidales bacterium]
MTTIDELARRVQLLEDMEAIRKLKFRYAEACDDHYNADKLAQLFTEGAIWDGGQLLGVYRGKKAIYEYFKNTTIAFAVHYFISPDIVINGDKAHARWYLWEATTRKDQIPRLLSGYEDDDYVKVNDQWLQSYLKLTLNFYTPLLEGWVKNRISI